MSCSLLKVIFYFRERFPYYEILPTDRGTPEFVHDDNTKYTPEELVAQLLAKAKEFAEISHGMECSVIQVGTLFIMILCEYLFIKNMFFLLNPY